MKENRKSWLIVSLFLLVIGGAANAKTIYVDADVSPGGGGINWSDAYKYLQDALADADASVKPVEIRVAQGTYKPDDGSGVEDANRTETFQLINEVTLKGGYAGFGEPDPNAWDVNDYETILSGDLDGNDVQLAPSDLLTEPTRAENSYHVVTGSDTNETAVLDGFTITAGNANETVNPNKQGAGMLAWTSSLTVSNCTFSKNSAYGIGGGLSAVGITTTNCTFSSNYAASGGGMFGGGETTVTNCTFNGNWGSGISLTYADGAAVSDCTFTGNSSSSGGGIYLHMGSPRLTNCTFIGNSANWGGGMCTMLDPGDFPNLINCIFSGNSSSSDGGAYQSTHDYTTFTNCTFSENSAGGDGGAYCITINGGTADFNNCILWGNTASGEGPQIAIKPFRATVTVTVDYSDVQGGELDVYIENEPSTTLIWDSNSNIDVDPCFVDADGADDTVGTEDDNLRLTNGSPCIDAGDNLAVPVGVNDDLNGFPRFIDDLCTVDTGNPGAPGPIVDMGAYEFLRSDIDSNGEVNFRDFSQFALYWQDVACGACGGADLTCDGDVNAYDLKELSDNWLW